MAQETQLRCCLDDQQRIRSALAGATWVDSTSTMRAARQIKSAAEIEKLRFVCAVTSRAFERVPDIIHAGMTDTDAFRAFRMACLQEGADNCAFLVGAASFEGYADTISPPADSSIGEGDILILDTGCTFDGYFSDFDRNFAVVKVDDATHTAHHRVWDATEAGLASVKAGVRCADVFRAMQNVLSIEDVEEPPADASVGRAGHGLGIELTETPSIAAFDSTILQSGMVITLEPGYRYSNNKMMVHEENAVVTDSGYELLSQRAPRNIPIIN